MAPTETLANRSTRRLDDRAATADLARRLAGIARPGDVIALGGPLGAGKTEFARAFIHERARLAGLLPDEVPSPTFTLVQLYDYPNGTIHHIDCYRLGAADEAVELGIEEAFETGITLIEWPERIAALLPADRLDLELDPGDKPDSRIATLTAHGAWRDRLAALGNRHG